MIRRQSIDEQGGPQGLF